MKLFKKKLTKKLWVDSCLWKVERVISPTKYDDYILLSRESETTVHEDGTIPIYMTLIDVHNDEFYPNTKEVRDIMKERQKCRERKMYEDDPLTNIWLSMFHDGL